MSNIWFPVPVATLFRRLVNAISTASIAHHYLLPTRSLAVSDDPPPEHDLDPRSACRVLRENGLQDVDGLDGFLKASGRLSVSWLRWPSRPSLFQPASRSANYAQQLAEPPRTDEGGRSSAPIPNSCPSPSPYPPSPPTEHENRGAIHRLMQSPVLYDPLRAPRFPIVLCHGLYGFDVRGPPSLRMQYWSSILGILRKIVGAEVIVTAVPGTGSIASRAEQLDRFLQAKAPGRGINFMAHSMGGLDCRHLITHLKPVDYTPLSLTTIATPHRGSPFMDWCKDYLGLGRRRPEDDEKRRASAATMTTIAESARAIDTASSSTSAEASSSSPTLSLSSLPSSFTTIAGRMTAPNIWHPLWFPKVVLDSSSAADNAGGNDGLVSVDSARWGEFLGTLEGADHWALRGASGIELDVDLSDAWGFAVDWGRALGLRRDEKPPSTAPQTKDEAASKDEAAFRSSTDRLSAVVDWLVEQVPVASRGAFSFAGAAAAADGAGAAGAGAGTSPHWHWPSSPSAPPKPKPKPRGDLESMRDLERLYVALARKLYDEGL
ncbi:alpha/beta-hydrolase [Lactarius psammicola]|nr:alpha/beta-hydrolase [Lactarius psammicola]